VAADDKLFSVSEESNTAVIQARRNWEILSVGSLDDGSYATPALADWSRTRQNHGPVGGKETKTV
jgi:hypothetical protein